MSRRFAKALRPNQRLVWDLRFSDLYSRISFTISSMMWRANGTNASKNYLAPREAFTVSTRFLVGVWKVCLRCVVASVVRELLTAAND